MSLSRRDRERHQQRREIIVQQMLEDEPSITPEDVFTHIEDADLQDALRLASRVIKKLAAFVICRVSDRHQQSHLGSQMLYTTKLVAKHGFTVVGGHADVCNGADPSYLDRVIARAQKAGARYVIAEAVDRFIRHPDFGRHNPHAVPTDEQLHAAKEKFKRAGITPVVLHAAGTSLQELSAMRSRRGHTARKMTQRYRRERQQVLLPVAKTMYRRGMSLSHVARDLALPLSLVKYWLYEVSLTVR